MPKNIFEEMGKLNPYTARVDRSHPSAFVFLIDQSGSMNNRINFGNKSISKSEAVADSVNKILAENTGKPLETVKIDTERDNFMSAYEAMEYGLVDKVIDKR